MMRLFYSLLFLSSVITLVGQTQGELSTRFDSQREGDHFVYQWNVVETNKAEIDEVESLAEEAFDHLTRIFGSERMPDKKMIITLRGEGVDRKTGRKHTPHVDRQGRIHLYRFDKGGYLNELPHEMVHAVRIRKVTYWQGFFEEGIASGVAYHLYPKSTGFPRFGYSLDLIAGYWLTSGKLIPMKILEQNHNRLNLKCQLQSYVLREDFFNYLINQYGLEGLVALSYAEDLGTDKGYERYTGKSFDALVADWEQDLTKRYEQIDQAEALVDEYFNNTTARYIPVCDAGSDF